MPVTISAKANILPRWYTTSLSCVFLVQATTIKKYRTSFFVVNGYSYAPTISMKGRIVHSYQTNTTFHILVPGEEPTKKVQSFDFAATHNVAKNIGMKARITK